MNISPDILEQLKCSVCRGWLSCPPVYAGSSGKHVCGRCIVPKGSGKEKFIRNVPYETAVSRTLFPCCNKNSGCEIKLYFSEVKGHEDVCPFNVHHCPTAVGDKR